MTKKKSLDSIKFIEVKDLKNTRFTFVENEILRENISIKMQYIVFLVSLEEEYELPGAVTYSTFKIITIYAASIIESLIHYKLDNLLKNERIKEANIMGKEIKYLNCIELHPISDTEKICGIKKVTKTKILSNNSSFHDLNKAAKKSSLFNDNLFKKAEELRQMRNRIHLYSLKEKEIDEIYSKDNINKIFSITKAIIDQIEKY